MAKFVLSAFADEAGDSLAEQIAALKENEIDFIEPRNIAGKPILTLTDDELHNVKCELDKNGIRVNSLGSPIGKFPIDEPLDNHLVDFEKALRACKILGTENIRMFSFFVEQDQLAEKKDEVIRRLKFLVDRANEEGIRLCHENESKIYGQMPEQVDEILSTVSGLRAVFDPANYRMNNADVYKGIKATLKNLAYMHIKDAIYETKQIVPAGEGEGQIAEILDLINSSTDETVYLTIEPHLHIFSAYKDIDEHELKGRYSFKNNRESFDFAVNALKMLLINHGYRKDRFNQWIK